MLGSIGGEISNVVSTLDNFGTTVCPGVAAVVGAVYGIPAPTQITTPVCKVSRDFDLAHWASVGIEDIFGGSSAPAGPTAAQLQAQAAALAAQQAAASQRDLLVGLGLVGAGVVAYLLYGR